MTQILLTNKYLLRRKIAVMERKERLQAMPATLVRDKSTNHPGHTSLAAVSAQGLPGTRLTVCKTLLHNTNSKSEKNKFVFRYPLPNIFHHCFPLPPQCVANRATRDCHKRQK